MTQQEAECLLIDSKVEHSELGECKVNDIMLDMGIAITPLTEAGLKLLAYWTDTDIANFLEDDYSKLTHIKDDN